jgi:hypothetical protein
MKIALDQFKSEIKEIGKKSLNHFRKNESDVKKMIQDGIVNITKYYHAPIRILWILKEPYGVGEYTMTEGLKKRASGNKKDKLWEGTRHPIIYIYTSYGLLNNYLKFNKMPKINDLSTNISSILEEIAFINIQKLSGGTSTTTSALKCTTLRIKKSKLFDPILLLEEVHSI